MKTTKSKTAESKAKYGTMTALEDSNNDYTSSSASSSASVSSSTGEYGTMTASQDANGDYSSNSASSANQNSKVNSQKQNSLTAQYDANKQS